MGQSNRILALVVIVLLILTGIFFPMDRPYWYISILTLILVVLIILVKIIWGVATWSDNQFRRHFGNENEYEIRFEDDEEKDGKEK